MYGIMLLLRAVFNHYHEECKSKRAYGFLNCDDICMCVVNKQLLEFVLMPFIFACSIMRFLSLLLLVLCASVVCAVMWLSMVCL